MNASLTRTGTEQRDAGAVAVEFALILPLFLAVLLGSLGFGRAMHTQLQLSNAAQEGARVLVFRSGATTAMASSAVDAAESLPGAPTVSVSGTCTSFGNVTVTASRPVTFDFVLGSFTRTITGTAVLRCGG